MNRNIETLHLLGGGYYCVVRPRRVSWVTRKSRYDNSEYTRYTNDTSYDWTLYWGDDVIKSGFNAAERTGAVQQAERAKASHS